MGEFNSDDHYIYYCGQEYLRRNGIALIANKRVQNAVPGCSLKNDRMVSICFQGKSFNTTVTQVCAPTTDSEEAEVEQFCEDLEDLLEINKQKKDVLFIIGDWNAKVGSQEIPGIMKSLALKYKMKQAKAVRVLSREHVHNSKQPFQQPKRQLYTWTVSVGQY